MIQHETGRASVVFGLDEDGNQAYTLEIEGVDLFEAWAGMKMMSDFINSRLQDSLYDSLGDIESDDDDEQS